MIKSISQHSYFQKKPNKQIGRLQNNPSMGWVRLNLHMHVHQLEAIKINYIFKIWMNNVEGVAWHPIFSLNIDNGEMIDQSLFQLLCIPIQCGNFAPFCQKKKLLIGIHFRFIFTWGLGQGSYFLKIYNFKIIIWHTHTHSIFCKPLIGNDRFVQDLVINY